MDLDDVLNEKAPEVKEEAPAEKTETVERAESVREAHRRKEDEARGRDPTTGKFLPKEEPKEVKAEPEVKQEVKEQKPEFTEKERAFLKAAEEERRKRQELERELAQYRQPKQEKTEEKKTFWDDPEGYFKSHEEKIAKRETALTLNVSEKLARSRYKDFDEKVEVFAESLKSTPGLHAEWLASPDPAEFAYRHGARVKEIREVGDIDKYREKIEKETRAKLEAEFKAKQEELEKARAALPGSLSDVRGASTQQKNVFTGPTPLEDILGRKS